MSGTEIDVSTGRLGRRRLIRDAGLVAAVAGAGVALLRDAPADAAATAVTALNVTDEPYNAVGDGVADDRGAIQRALDDVGESGGAVFLPPGDYVVSGPLAPRSRTLMYGWHVPRWDKPVDPPSASRIRAGGGFEGGGLIAPDPDAVAVALRGLALVGDDVGSRVHGIRMPDASEAAGALSWRLEDLTIAGFSGSGVFGRLHVGILQGCFIHSNRAWGIEASGGDRWNDVHVANSFLFFNRLGDLYFGGSGVSAGIDFVNCRFERAGTNPADVLSPLRPDSPGARLASARLVQFANCSTDGNTGNGFEVIRESDTPANLPSDILFANCRFNRDGTGDQRSLGEFAGVKVKGRGPGVSEAATNVRLANCHVGYGKASDNGEGTVEGPRYGIWYENTRSFSWVAGSVSPSPQATGNAYKTGAGGNHRPTIVDLEHGLMTLPLDEPVDVPRPEGAAYFDAAGRRLRVWDGTTWLSAELD